MTKREAAIISAFTEVLIGDFEDFHSYVNEIMGRPVFTHELGRLTILNEIRERSENDFMNIKITDN